MDFLCLDGTRVHHSTLAVNSGKSMPILSNRGSLGGKGKNKAALVFTRPLYFWAGGTGIEPATCGCGVFRRSFRDVQGSTLKMAQFDGPTCQDVHQRSPALGSKLESKQPEIHLLTGCHLAVSVSRTAGESRLTNPKFAFPDSHQPVDVKSGVKRLCEFE